MQGKNPPLRGNPCLVRLAASAPKAPPASNSITQCVSWPVGPDAAQVRCWAPGGTEIELCGHGLLCCASTWQDAGEERELLKMNGVAVRFTSREGLGWLGFPTLEVEPCELPPWGRGLLGSTPQRAARTESAAGYLVLEIPSDCDPAALPAPGAALAELTTRSLIVTRRVAAQDALLGETIQYRYFAPQFGVPEDTATGSAMRVLASYWQGRGTGDEQKALQRSADGGWLESRIEGERTWIGGHVEADTAEGAA